MKTDEQFRPLSSVKAGRVTNIPGVAMLASVNTSPRLLSSGERPESVTRCGHFLSCLVTHTVTTVITLITPAQAHEVKLFSATRRYHNGQVVPVHSTKTSSWKTSIAALILSLGTSRSGRYTP